MELALILGRALLIGVFATAAVTKLLDLPGTRRALLDFGVPQPAVRAAALLVPAAELATALALALRPSARWGAIAALLLLGAFAIGIVAAMRRGEQPDCHCFGQLHSEPAGPRTLTRNATLAVVAAFVAAAGPGPSLTAWLGDRSDAELVALGMGAVVGALVACVAWLSRSNRRLRRELAAAEEVAIATPVGLPAGVRAPGFSLRSPRGEAVTLETLLAGRRPVGLVFVDPDCHPCRMLLPDVARWQRALADRITLAVISTAPADPELQRLDGAAHALLGGEDVMREYRLAATPTAVIVTPDGRIAGAGGGSWTIEAMIRRTLEREAGEPVAAMPAA